MALVDDLKDYISRNSRPNISLDEKHSVAIIGEIHPFLKSTDADIRGHAVERLAIEILSDPEYRYFGNEAYLNSGPVRPRIREYLQNKQLPPPFDPKQQPDMPAMDIAQRVLVRRYQKVLDFVRAHPRYVLSIGSVIDPGRHRDEALAKHFFEEIADRKLHVGTKGVLVMGGNHAAAVSDHDWPTVRNLLENRKFSCVTIRVLTDFSSGDTPDDVVVPLGTPLDNIQTSDMIRLTSLVTRTPVTITTDRLWTNNRPSPFRQVTFGVGNNSVASQCEYIVLQKA